MNNTLILFSMIVVFHMCECCCCFDYENHEFEGTRRYILYDSFLMCVSDHVYELGW